MRYHHISNTIAHKSLAAIEEQKGKLDATLKNQADAYAVETLGWKGYAPWLYVYSAINGDFKEGWIPDNYYGRVVIPKIQGAYGKISSLKPLCNKLFDTDACPDIVSFINGFWFDRNLKPLTIGQLQQTIFADTETVICKLDTSYQGRDVFRLEKRDFNRGMIEKKGDCVIQKFIDQHPFFNAFVGSAVATIRVTTVVDTNDQISLRACYLRLGRASDTHVRSMTHIRIPMDMKSGALKGQGYLPNWHTIDKHPDSKVVFSDKIIPAYDECIRMVLRLHERMPMVRAIGWDVIVDKEGYPKVMEWNGYSNDIKFSEATQGPCFKDLNWEQLK